MFEFGAVVGVCVCGVTFFNMMVDRPLEGGGAEGGWGVSISVAFVAFVRFGKVRNYKGLNLFLIWTKVRFYGVKILLKKFDIPLLFFSSWKEGAIIHITSRLVCIAVLFLDFISRILCVGVVFKFSFCLSHNIKTLNVIDLTSTKVSYDNDFLMCSWRS